MPHRHGLLRVEHVGKRRLEDVTNGLNSGDPTVHIIHSSTAIVEAVLERLVDVVVYAVVYHL
eukprot:5823863-Lingulodinium_polyedra.AAC.1